MPHRRLWPGLLLGSLLLAACAESGADGPASVLLITLDTTRADALGCYGNPRSATPRLDGLASAGLRFTRAYTVAPLTLPAHSAMLTGLLPPHSSVRSNGPYPLPAAADTLAEHAARAGIATAAFVSAAVLDPSFGLAQGFDTYDTPVLASSGKPASSGKTEEAERPARETVARAAHWLEAHAGQRFFLWVHLFDPHAPYAPPTEFRTGALAGEPYLGEVAAMDQAVGTLLDALERAGAVGRTTVVAVGDHGEGLGQHAETTHGSFCYDSTLRVPLIVRAPRGRRGEVDTRLASVVDVFATLGEALGLAGLDPHDGTSLLAPTGDAQRGLYFESYTGYLSFGWSPLAGWLDARGKYLHSSEPEFYDLVADPGETKNLFGTASVEPYRAAIDRVFSAPALEIERTAVADGELLAQIRALGYVGATREDRDLPHPLEPSDRPSPSRMAGEEEKLQRAFQLVAGKDCERATPILDELIAANPHNPFALDMKAHCLARGGDMEGAIALLRRVASEKPLQAENFQRLGKFLAEASRFDEALAAYAGGLEVDPEHVPCLQGLIETLAKAGRHEEAARYRARLPR